MTHQISTTAIQNIRSRVIHKENGCMEWAGATMRGGYGVLRNGKTLEAAHRLAYKLEYGDIPLLKGLQICHSCDNPRCINPEHLFLGTQSDNILDMYDKGRHPNLKRTPVLLREAKKLRRKGLSYKAIANRLKVSQSTARTWALKEV